MDPHVVLIGVTVFIVSAILIYLISVFGIKEKSYEEAIAEQRKRLEEEQEKSRRDKKAEKEKKKGGKAKKEKPKENVEEAPKPKERKMLNLEIEAEIIEPFDSAELKQKPTTVKQRSKPKSILANKDEKPLVSKETVEMPHFKPLPKDDVELKHEHEKKKEVKMDKEKMGSPKISKKHKPVEEDVIVEQMTKATFLPMESKPKKGKQVQGKGILFFI